MILEVRRRVSTFLKSAMSDYFASTYISTTDCMHVWYKQLRQKSAYKIFKVVLNSINKFNQQIKKKDSDDALLTETK